ncbi:MAG: BspA family leucine-rich repeat surface protein [Thermoplasmata archaeon]
MMKPKNNIELRKLIKKVLKKQIKLNDIDVSEIQDFSYVFKNFKFKSQYGSIENWNVSKGKKFKNMFENSNVNFDLSNWNMTNAIDCSYMFSYCEDFEGIGLNKWFLPNLKNAESMFENCFNFDNDLSNWNMQNVQNLNGMFYSCYKFRGIGLNKWLINLNSNPYCLDYTFTNCYQLDFDISNWKIHIPIALSNTFDNCESFKGKGFEKIIIKIHNEDLSLKNSFYNCYNLKTLPIIKNSIQNQEIFISDTLENCYSFKTKNKKIIGFQLHINNLQLSFTNKLPYENAKIKTLKNIQLPNIYPIKINKDYILSRRKALKQNFGKIYGFGNVKKLNQIDNQIDEHNLKLCHNLVKFCKFKINEKYKNYYRLMNDNKTILINSPNCIVEKFNFNEKSFIFKKNIFLNKNFKNKYFCFK